MGKLIVLAIILTTLVACGGEDEEIQSPPDLNEKEIVDVKPTSNPTADITRLTNNSSYDYSPFWSPDGTKIAFTSERDGNAEIYIMNSDGTKQTRLTNTFDIDEWATSWSSDGSKIAFESDRDGNWQIFVMDNIPT